MSDDDQASDRGSLSIQTGRTSELDDLTRAAVVHLCVEAHDERDFENLFSHPPPEGLHVLATLGDDLVGHAVVTTRWLQPQDMPLLRTAYVDAVATSPAHQGRGIGSAVMRHLAAAAEDHEIACLETELVTFYERLGWERWRGPLAGRSEDGLIPTPDQDGIMILRLSRTPALDLDAMLTIEAHPASDLVTPSFPCRGGRVWLVTATERSGVDGHVRSLRQRLRQGVPAGDGRRAPGHVRQLRMRGPQLRADV